MPSTLRLELQADPSTFQKSFYSLSSRRDVSELLEVPYQDLLYILIRSGHTKNYRIFDIRKKDGGLRKIAEPPTSLKILQTKLLAVLEKVYRPRRSVHGFTKGRSIVTNARKHVGRKFVLNLDLFDFFPSCNFGRVRGMFLAPPYRRNAEVATVLAQVCCWNNQLPQGAPTSPIVANMLCAKLDSSLERLAGRYGCFYTRYADDLTFSLSKKSFPKELAMPKRGLAGSNLTVGKELADTIESNGFRINTSKTRLQLRNSHQEVTGLTVNEFPNVSRTFIRQMRAMIHAWEKYGLEEAQREFQQKYDHRSRFPDKGSPSFAHVMSGKLAFLTMVRGKADRVCRRFQKKLHLLDPDTFQDVVSDAGDLTDPVQHSFAQYYEKYRNLVYHLEIKKENGDTLSGTAFAYKDGVLATVAHNLIGSVNVISPQSIQITHKHVHPEGSDRVDVALLQVTGAASSGFRFLPRRRSNILPGEPVAALAFPTIARRRPGLGLYSGQVESIVHDYHGVEFIQVNIRISGGMSGAPVIDRSGEVVGIVVEETFEQAQEDIPSRPFGQVLPINRANEISF